MTKIESNDNQVKGIIERIKSNKIAFTNKISKPEGLGLKQGEGKSPLSDFPLVSTGIKIDFHNGDNYYGDSHACGADAQDSSYRSV